jgi:hypothetical protein
MCQLVALRPSQFLVIDQYRDKALMRIEFLRRHAMRPGCGVAPHLRQSTAERRSAADPRSGWRIQTRGRGSRQATMFRLADALFAIALHAGRTRVLRWLSGYFLALPGNRDRTARRGFVMARSRM